MSSCATRPRRCGCGSGTTARARRVVPGAGAGAAEGPGHGLLGMRERAATVGGSLRTGAASGGGFLVEAVLPAEPEAT